MTQEAITSYDAMGREVSSTDQNTGGMITMRMESCSMYYPLY